MRLPIKGVHIMLAAALASASAFAGDPLQHACHSGLFQRTDKDPKEHPLPPFHKLEALVDRTGFRFCDVRNGERAVFQVFAGHPGPGAPAKDVGEEINEDGGTMLAPVDLTGSGVSDLIYARKGWSGWKVLSNGTRLPKPFPGFICGLLAKSADTAKAETIPADTSELVVDNDLLAAVGDFLGNGTEQLAYTRPGWNQVWIVGAHGVAQMAVDLQGIEGGGSGARVHWLFPFKAKGAQHTKLAYYRMGSTQLVTFAPRGMAFKREALPLKGNWEKLAQNELAWPQDAPSQLEQKATQAKDAVAKAIGLGQ